MTRYALIAALGLALVLGGFAWLQQVQKARYKVANELLRNELAVMQRERDVAREGRRVADALAARLQAKATEYDAIRESILRGGNDADLPDWFLDHLRSIRAIGVQ